MITRRSFIKGVAAAMAFPGALIGKPASAVPVSIGGTGASTITKGQSLGHYSLINTDFRYSNVVLNENWFARIESAKFNGEMEIGAVR